MSWRQPTRQLTGFFKDMEIRLGKKYESETEATRIEFLDSITKVQLEKFQLSLSEIEGLNYIKRLLDFVLINEEEIIEFLNQSLEKLVWLSTSLHRVTRNDYNHVYSNTNRLLLNYLSSIKTFIDHLETFISRKFGDESQEFIELKKLLSLIYDNSSNYRFFYKLRNYTQHVGLPIHNIEFRTYLKQEEKFRLKGDLKISFNRDKLLAEFKKWGNVKDDLVKEDEMFDLVPRLNVVTHDIIEIERNARLILKPGLIKAVENVNKVIGHLRNGNGEVFIAYNIKTKENGELANYQSIMIPFDTIDSIQNEFGLGV
jgi:hypothetical protein